MAITRAQQARQMLKEGTKKPAMQGGGPNYLGKQPEVTVPRKWKSSPDHPDTELAYITEPEKKVLIALNMHGGLEDGKPNKGPKGVMSLQGDMGSIGGGKNKSGGGGNQNTGNAREDYISNYVSKGKVKGGGKKITTGPDVITGGGYEDYTVTGDDVRKAKDRYEKQFYDKGQVPPLGSRPTTLRTKINQRNLQKRLNYINRLIEARQNKIRKGLIDYQDDVGQIQGLTDFDTLQDYIDKVQSVDDLVASGFYKSDGQFATGEKIPDFASMDMPGMLSIFQNIAEGPVTSDRLNELMKEIDTLKSLQTTSGLEGTNFNKLMETYEPNRFKLDNPEPGGRDDTPTDPCKGPNPPAYCFIGEKADETVEAQRNLGGLSTRIGGSLFDFTGMADGGRIGFKGGADMGTVSTPTRTATAKSVNISPSGNVTTSRDRGPEGPDDRSTFEQTVNQRRIVNEAKKQKPSNLENMFRTGSELNYLRNLIRMNPQGLGISYLTNKIGNFLFPPAGAAEFDMEAFQKAGADKGFLGMNDELEAMQKYYDFAQKQKAMGKNPAAIRDSANIGSALYGIDMDLVPETFLQTEEDFAKQKAPESFFAKGGIAGLDREAFLLGGIAKGLKKAVRGVKKLAKSPIGKAAILGAVGFGLGGKGAIGSFFGKGSFNPFLRKVAGDTAFSGLGSILSKAGLVNKAGSLTALGMIGVPTVASLFMTPKEDENDELAKYLASQKLEPSQSIRGMGSEFDFYGGERMRVADGGDVEPVAKKTMPLLDMDGKEKDYRETGGFVDMGRMERADDVPARLSKNEFVFTADAVRNAGEGDIDKGAEVMYNMMKNLESGGEVSEESQGLEGAREMFQTSQRLGEVI